MSNSNASSPATSTASASRTWFRQRSTTVLAAVAGALGALLLGPGSLRAETAAASATADISGVLIPDDKPSTSPARTLLVVPQALTATLALPVRGGFLLNDRVHVYERLVDIFFNDARTFGVYPMLKLETGLPTGVGLRLVHKNLFGSGARLGIGADYGGESRNRLEGSLRSPAFAGGLARARVGGGWLRQPNAAFFGIGDQDLSATGDGARDLPARAPFAVATKFGQDVTHAELAAELDPAGPLFAAVSTAYFQRAFRDTPAAGGGDANDPGVPPSPQALGSTDVRFDTATLTGWDQGSKLSYSELQLGWNSLTVANPFVSLATPSSGTKVVVFAGLARGVAGSNARYSRYGVDAFRYFDLYQGDRVLILRGRLEGVDGADERIPFTDLPRLGGPTLLRGYARDRFRDRVAVLASLEYRYPIWSRLSGFLFADAGRVLPDLKEAGRTALSPQLLRPSGGAGLEVIQVDNVLMRAQVAGSPEGVFLQFALGPVYRLPTHNYRI